ncbi:hypothetical protein [Lacticaseibacillus paracasei]|uniref:hypothetical protein n=1 Tax=Lacticaseibacillus paracasei TaxID=1597 RepID=UPI0021CED17F|nr:hypothetical protein [Lacticaseibacillus paracasei]MCU6430265.1 hypothetical protein [Lacticaseibacillus paracasei]
MILEKQLSLTTEDAKILLQTKPTKKYYDSVKRGLAMKNIHIDQENLPQWMTEIVTKQIKGK